MTIRVESREDLSHADRDAIGVRLAHMIKENVGVSVTCDVGLPGAVARSEGKAQRVVDHRG